MVMHVHGGGGKNRKRRPHMYDVFHLSKTVACPIEIRINGLGRLNHLGSTAFFLPGFPAQFYS